MSQNASYKNKKDMIVEGDSIRWEIFARRSFNMPWISTGTSSELWMWILVPLPSSPHCPQPPTTPPATHPLRLHACVILRNQPPGLRISHHWRIKITRVLLSSRRLTDHGIKELTGLWSVSYKQRCEWYVWKPLPFSGYFHGCHSHVNHMSSDGTFYVQTNHITGGRR